MQRAEKNSDDANKSSPRSRHEASTADDVVPGHPDFRVATLRAGSEAPTKRLYHTPGEGFAKPSRSHASHAKASDSPNSDDDMPSRTAASPSDAPSSLSDNPPRTAASSADSWDSQYEGSSNLSNIPSRTQASSSDSSDPQDDAYSRYDTSSNGDEVKVESVISTKEVPSNRHVAMGDQQPAFGRTNMMKTAEDQQPASARANMMKSAEAPGPQAWLPANAPLSARDQLFLSSKEAMQRSWAQRLGGKRPLDLTQYVG
jgi:hypothetical protein